jgi:deoxyribodipyrimidine photolyase
MTTVVLSPLRKQGDISKIPAAPTAVLLQGSKHFSDGHVIAYAGLKHFSDSHVGMYTGLRHFPARHVSTQLHPPLYTWTLSLHL